MSLDYQKELEKYADAPPEEKAELAKLAGMQKDIAVGDSAEDFVRHPFFKAFENHMNDVINDSKGRILKALTFDDVKTVQAEARAIAGLKEWINSKVIAGRVAKQAIDVYEQETDSINTRIQAAVDSSKISE